MITELDGESTQKETIIIEEEFTVATCFEIEENNEDGRFYLAFETLSRRFLVPLVVTDTGKASEILAKAFSEVGELII